MATSLRYPSNVDDWKLPFVTFTFLKSDNQGKRVKAEGVSPIILFMPPAFQIADGHDYEFAESGALFTALGAFDSMSGLARGILSYGMTKLMPGAKAQAAAAIGDAVRDPKFFNYKEPKAREFTFTYNFKPKNAVDANAMMTIINTFRTASYPTRLGAFMYGVPDSVAMKFENVQVGIEETLANLVIKDMNTTLSEGEQMLTFDGGIPTQVGFNITFAETSLLSKDKTGKVSAESNSGRQEVEGFDV